MERCMTEPFVLTPPDDKDLRFTLFKQVVASFYRWKWGIECPWDASEGNQLKRLLKASPTLDIHSFRVFLYNYGCSNDITPGERPRSFLPRIYDYSITPLDRFRRNPNAAIDSAQTQRARRNDTAFEQARQNRRIAQGPERNLPPERVEQRGNRTLGNGFKRLSDAG